MGASSSKFEEDKSLILCRERKRFVKQAIENRCTLAATHVAYIQSLRNTGTALSNFVQPEIHSESSLYTTSTSATPEPLALTEKSVSQFSNSSPSPSQRVENSYVYSPTPSPPHSQRFHVNHMKAGKINSRTVEESLPVSQRVQSSLNFDDSTFEAPPPPGTPPPPGIPPWDYFDFFNPIDRQFSFQDDKDTSPRFQSNTDISRLREEEGIPDLEDEVDKSSSVHERESDGDHFEDTDDEFDNPSSEPLVKMFKNRNAAMNHKLSDQYVGDANLNLGRHDVDKITARSSKYESDETSAVTPTKETSSAIIVSVNGKYKDFGSENKLRTKDFFSCIKEMENLFLDASESGREIPMMLEANKVPLRPLFRGGIVHKPKLSEYLTAWFTCCIEEPKLPQAPATNEVKYMTWHRSASSRSSSSRNPLGPTSKDEADNIGSNLFGSICMNSGSHASTLDRLFAWEKKLYDEIKVSGIIRREYDLKCKLLRDRDSREEHLYKVEKTRASVKDLHTRIRVAIQRIDSISKRIEEIRDIELQPQLEELIEGLTRMWRMMLESHKSQYNIITSASNNGTTKLSSTRSESHKQAALLLQAELNSLCTSFTKWITTHKSYLESINGWLLKCISLPPTRQKKSFRKNPPSFSPKRSIAPPIFVTCRDWLNLIDELPTKEVEKAIKDLVDVTAHFLPRQEKGNGAKRRGLGYEELHETESTVINYDNLQSGLVVFFDKLKLFAEKTVFKYEELQKEIGVVKIAYDKAIRDKKTAS